MKQFLNLLFLFLIFFVACTKTKDIKENSNVNFEKTVAKSTPTVTKKVDEEDLTEIVRNFIKWYRDNSDRIGKINTIEGGPFSNLKEDEIPENYRVNFQEVDKYLNELRKSGFLSEKYIQGQKQSYIDGDKYFKENPTNDGPPFGFDYDPVYRTQDDYETDVRNIEKIKIIIKSKSYNTAEVYMHFPTCGMEYTYVLSKYNNIWKIDEIK